MKETKAIRPPYRRLKGALREQGLSYEDTADLMHLSPSSVCNKLNGRSDFTLQEGLFLAKFLGLGLEELFPTSSLFLPESFELDNI